MEKKTRRLEVGEIENYISRGYQFQKAFQLLKIKYVQRNYEARIPMYEFFFR
jgi:hypothetical protein